MFVREAVGAVGAAEGGDASTYLRCYDSSWARGGKWSVLCLGCRAREVLVRVNGACSIWVVELVRSRELVRVPSDRSGGHAMELPS